MNTPPSRSFWFDEELAGEAAQGIAPVPTLREDIRAGVCIVGGGYTGLWTALDLKFFERAPAYDAEGRLAEATRRNALIRRLSGLLRYTRLLSVDDFVVECVQQL